MISITHKFKRGDKVGAWSDYFLAFVPATVTSTEKNLVNVVYGKQSFTVDEDDVVMREPSPRPRREVLRISERLK